MERGLLPSRHRAQEAIAAGDVLVDGIVVTRVAAQVEASRSVALRDTGIQWVGRGALKLLGVLKPLGIDPTGLICADLGASTGGFTHVLLEHGASKVHAVDVGKNLLHERVRSDPRVVVHEEINVRHLTALPDAIALAVVDLSFISVEKVLPALHALLEPGASAVVLVKPQFEVGREHVASGGVVRDQVARRNAIERVGQTAKGLGFEVVGGIDSPVAGARGGNVEHFLHLRRKPDQPVGC